MKRSLIDKLDDIRMMVKRVRIIPSGAENPLPLLPDDLEIDEDDLDEMSAVWNETMPDYAGLLDAEVINKENAE